MNSESLLTSASAVGSRRRSAGSAGEFALPGIDGMGQLILFRGLQGFGAGVLLGLIFTDAETKLLPDQLTLTGLALGIVFSLLVPVNDLVSQFLPGLVNLPFSADISGRLLSLLDSLLGSAVGAAFIYGAGAIYLFTRSVVLLGASRAVLFPSLVPPFSLLVGYLTIGEVPTVSQLAGLVIVIAGFRLTQRA